MKRGGFSQVLVLVGLSAMSLALLAATELVQNNQDVRNKAATVHCVGEGGLVANGTAGCCDNLIKQNCGGSGSFTYCYCRKPVVNPTITPVYRSCTTWTWNNNVCTSSTYQRPSNLACFPSNCTNSDSTPVTTLTPTSTQGYVPTGAICGGMFVVGNTCSYCEFGTEVNWLGQKFCNRIQYLKVTVDGNKYIFSLVSYPDGEIGDMIKKLKETTGKSSFSMVVNPLADPYLSKMIKDVMDSLPTGFSNDKSLTVEDKLKVVVSSINSTIKSRNISYYQWSQSLNNLKKYVGADTQLLGSRIEKGYFTCFEAALLAKTVLSKLGMTTRFSYAGVHLFLKYQDTSGNMYDVDVLRSMYLN